MKTELFREDKNRDKRGVGVKLPQDESIISGTVSENPGRMVVVIQCEICYKAYAIGGDRKTASFTVLSPQIQHDGHTNLLRWQRH
jgi:hypothetical protein